MSKKSKSCKYTGHMHILNRGSNETKEIFDATQNKSHSDSTPDFLKKHVKKGSGGIVYPEDKCTCKK